MSSGASSPEDPAARRADPDRAARSFSARKTKRRWAPILIGFASVVIVFGAVGYFVSHAEQWPRIHATIQRLGLTAEELLEADPQKSSTDEGAPKP